MKTRIEPPYWWGRTRQVTSLDDGELCPLRFANAMTDRLALEGGVPVRSLFLPFGVPSIGEDEIDEVVATLRSGWIGQGPRVAEFEQAFRSHIGAAYAVAVSSCTAALHLSLLAAGVEPGDEVLVPDLTFAATATAVEHAGAVPVFCDIDEHTLNIDLEDCKRRLTTRTSAIVVVHFGGLPCEMDQIVGWAKSEGLRVIEDAAHALGATLDGSRIGSSPDTLCCFSFYPNKNITTGEGGMITLGDEAASAHLRSLRLHGLTGDAWRRYRDRSLRPSALEMLGFKCNLTDIQAALGLCQLRRLETFQLRREEIARRYDETLGTIPGLRFQPRSLQGHVVRHALHLYVILVDEEAFSASRDQIVAALRAENIGAAIHYEALHLEPYYLRRFAHSRDEFPVARSAGERILSVPLSPTMTDEDADDVIAATHKVFARYAVR